MGFKWGFPSLLKGTPRAVPDKMLVKDQMATREGGSE
jgi:hypothetical protein